MARFIVADLTDPSSIPKELEAISSLTLPCPFNPCSRVRHGPMRCSRTTGSTTGCFRSTDTRELSRCSQRLRKRHRPCGRKGESLGTTKAHDRGGTDQALIGHQPLRPTARPRSPRAPRTDPNLEPSLLQLGAARWLSYELERRNPGRTTGKPSTSGGVEFVVDHTGDCERLAEARHE